MGLGLLGCRVWGFKTSWSFPRALHCRTRTRAEAVGSERRVSASVPSSQLLPMWCRSANPKPYTLNAGRTHEQLALGGQDRRVGACKSFPPTMADDISPA